MPLLREPACCWILVAEQECTGDEVHAHWPVGDPASLGEIEQLRWHLFANNPMRNPPRAVLWDEPCLVVVCGGCGGRLGGGEHFAEAGDAWAAASEDGWLGDRCRSCQPSPQPVV